MIRLGRVGFRHRAGRKVFFGRRVILESDAELFEIVQALRPPRRFTGALNGRQQKRDQHADNRDDDEQFDERKGGSCRTRRSGHGAAIERLRRHTGVLPSFDSGTWSRPL